MELILSLFFSIIGQNNKSFFTTSKFFTSKMSLKWWMIILLAVALLGCSVEAEGNASVTSKSYIASHPWWYWIIFMVLFLFLISCCWLWYNKKIDPMDLCRAALPAAAELGSAAKKGLSASTKKVANATATTLSAAANSLETATATDGTGNYAGSNRSNAPRDQEAAIEVTSGQARNVPSPSSGARARVPLSNVVSNRFESIMQKVLASRPLFVRRLQNKIANRINKAKWSKKMKSSHFHRSIAADGPDCSIILSSVTVQQPPGGAYIPKSFSEDSRITYSVESDEDGSAGSLFGSSSEKSVVNVCTSGDFTATAGESKLLATSDDSLCSFSQRKRAAASSMQHCVTLESDISFLSSRVLTLEDLSRSEAITTSSLNKLVAEWRAHRAMDREVHQIKVIKNMADMSVEPQRNAEHTPVIELGPLDKIDKTTTIATDDTVTPQVATNIYSATGDTLSR